MKLTAILSMMFYIASCQPCYSAEHKAVVKKCLNLTTMPCFSANGGARHGAHNVLFRRVQTANHGNCNILDGGARVGPKTVRKGQIIAAIIAVEGDDGKVGPAGEVGPFQITPIMVREVNRIAGTRFKMADRWDAHCSLLMFFHFQNYWNPTWDAETAARLWQGGSNFKRTPRNNAYWQLIKEKL